MLDISKHEFLCMVGKLGPPVSTNFSAGPPPIFHGASNFFFMGPPSHFFGASNQKARGGGASRASPLNTPLCRIYFQRGGKSLKLCIFSHIALFCRIYMQTGKETLKIWFFSSLFCIIYLYVIATSCSYHYMFVALHVWP